MMKLRSLAVAQTCPIRGDVKANMDAHLKLVQVAAAAGAQLVLFPELSLTGYEISLAPELALSEDDPLLSPLMDVAAASSVTLVVGAPVRLGSQLFIAVFILYPDRTTALYTKQRLGAFSASAAVDGVVPPAEASVFHPGDHNPLVQLGASTAAVAICADINQPSHPQWAAARGASIYLASMFVIPSEFGSDSIKLEGYAKRHAMLVALANHGCPTGGLAAAGRSSIWSETGELLVQLEARGAGVAVVSETSKGWQAQTFMLSD